jgi:hypothetical protein
MPASKALSSSRRRWCGEKAKSLASATGSLLSGAEAERRLGADSLTSLGLAKQHITTVDLLESRPKQHIELGMVDGAKHSTVGSRHELSRR